ncbi:MAG: DUF4089 domain-containing protein [Comamonadaceae bacterium]|nr:MAG: DUF4089 domain-containing protein [Comamonadaceae bacterium]
MNEEQVLAYVKATATLLEVPLDAARARAVAGHLGRTAALARMLDAVPLQVHDEPAEIYCPAPFPGEEAAP